MVVCSINSRIKWYWYTDDFPFWSLKYGKLKVPEETTAWEYFAKNKQYSTTETVYADDWFKVYFDEDRERRFYEHCVYGKNGTVISIIWEN